MGCRRSTAIATSALVGVAGSPFALRTATDEGLVDLHGDPVAAEAGRGRDGPSPGATCAATPTPSRRSRTRALAAGRARRRRSSGRTRTTSPRTTPAAGSDCDGRSSPPSPTSDDRSPDTPTDHAPSSTPHRPAHARAPEPVRPPHIGEELAARVVVGEPRLERLPRPRVVDAGPRHHRFHDHNIWGPLELRRYPIH